MRFSGHCLRRMRERQVDALDIIRVLRSGKVSGAAYRDGSGMDWRHKIVGRDLAVIVAIEPESLLLVITTYWAE